MDVDQPLPSKDLNDAFADYEEQLTKTADKRIKGRQSAIRYNRRRFVHALKRLQNAKITLSKDDNDDRDVDVAAASSTRKIPDERTISPALQDRTVVRTARQNCRQRLSLVADESAKMRTMLSDSEAAEERLEKIRRDPRRRKIDTDVDNIVKELDEIDDKYRRGKIKTTAKT